MGEGVKETITPDDIKDWITINDDGKVNFDKDAMSEWIEEFCLKYKRSKSLWQEVQQKN